MFEALFEHSSLGIIISDEQGVIQDANPFAARIFGYENGELNGRAVEVLIPGPLRERHVKYREGYIRNPVPRSMGSNLNLLAVKKDGSQFPVEISLAYFELDGRRQIVSFVNDITIRKKVEQDLLKLTEELETKVNERTKELSDALLELGHTNEGLQQEMEQRKKVESQIRGMLEREKELGELKSRFVSMASHEFRTPLGGILSSASLISKYTSNEDQPKREKHVLTIKKMVKNLTNILNDFLSLDKLEQGKVTSAPVQFDLNQLINELSQDMIETSDKDLSITGPGSDEISVYQDKEMVRNVLINLISNAIKYSATDPKVSIRSKKTDTNAVIEIEDNGIGIPEADQKHLFERFFRAKNVTNLQGTGLGLNIVKRYLDMMNGSITFRSVENKGTTFTVILPLEKK
jgi:PAS domain S-box-containing protein